MSNYYVDYQALFDYLCPNVKVLPSNGTDGTSPSEGNGSDAGKGWLSPEAYDCTNFSSLMEYHDYDLQWVTLQPERYMVPIIFGVTLALGLIGNSLVVYVVLRSGAMKTVTNMYLVNLAVSDLLFLIFCVPFTGVVYITPNWPFGEPMCKIVNYMMGVTMATSVMTMTAMSIDRYHAVVSPVRSKAYRTVKRTFIVLLLIWLVNLITLVPIAVISRLMQYWDQGGNQDFCLEYFEEPYQRQIYTIAVFLLHYALPLLIIGISYFLMAKTLWSSVSPGFLQTNMVNAMKSRRRVSKMVLVIITVFAICWLPIHCVHLRNDFGEPRYSTAYYVIKIGAHCLSYVNSAVNPVIYAFMSENFRQCFKAAFACRCIKTKGHHKVFIVYDPEALPGSHSSGSKKPTGSSDKSNHSVRMAMRVAAGLAVDPEEGPAAHSHAANSETQML